MPPELVRAHLERVLASVAFTHAPTLARLLRYLAEYSVDGHAGAPKEYTIGVELFGRGPTFDPHTDTIVRAHARRLRRRLDEYYAGDGRDEALRLEVPKGHYAVRCRLASAPGDRPASDGPLSIAVLPFVNVGSSGDSEHFADGLTDEITSALAALAGLHVVARTSAFQFKGRGEDIRHVGRMLGVQLALEGSVRRDGGSVRVTTRLVETREGFLRWSQTYEGDLGAVFRIQDEITRAIVDSLRGRLALPPPAWRAAAAVGAEAYDSYLRGRYFWYKATPDDVARAIRYLERAIALAPSYAAAYSALADAHVFLATLELEAPGPLMESARRAAQTALDLEELAEGHSAMGTVLGMWDWNWTAAQRAFRRALELMPSLASARAAYAVACLAPLRRYDEAVDQLRQAVRLDPLSVFVRTMLGQVLLLAGRFDEAIEEVENALELDPGSLPAGLTLAWAQLGAGDFAGAIESLERLPAAAAALPNFTGHLGYAHARLGHRASAELLLSDLLARFPGPWVPGVDVAAIYSGLDDTEAARHWIRRARDLRSFDFVFVQDDPRFASLGPDWGGRNTTADSV